MATYFSTETGFNSTKELELREKGLDQPVPPKVGEMPAGGAEWAIPHFLTFASTFNLPQRTYRALFDEALKHSRVNAEACYNDIVVQEALFTRKYPTSQIAFHLEPQDPTDPEQIRAAAKVTSIIENFLDFDDMRFALLEGMWTGRGAVQVLYKYGQSTDDVVMKPVAFKPINGDKLIFRFSGDIGILVNALYTGPLEKIPTDGGGWAAMLTPKEREQIILYHHELHDQNFYEGYQAGQIQGIGIRSKVYWPWFMKAQMLALVLNYAERFANGIPIGTFPVSQANGEAALINSVAALAANKIFVTPTGPDGKPYYDYNLKEVSTANPAFLLDFIQDYFDRLIRRYILGEIESLGESGGVGGDEASMKMDSLAGIRRWDSKRLDIALSKDFIPTLYRYNCGSCPPARFMSDVDSPNAGEILGHAQVLQGLGADIDLDHLRGVTGLPKPATGSEVGSPAQPMSPVAAAGTPNQVPMAGPSGPQQPQGQPQMVNDQVVAQPGQQQPAATSGSIIDA